MRKILLNLEISTKCRAACSMCPRKHVPKNKFIDDDLVNIIISVPLKWDELNN